MSETTVTRRDGVGMITLRADLGADAVVGAVADLTGTGVPGQREIVTKDDMSVAWMSPDEVLILLPAGQAEAAVQALSAALKDTHHLAVNVSDARAILRIAGQGAREVIAKGAPVDMEVFAPGEIRRTRLGQVACAFWISGDAQVDLVCFRSVGQFVEDWLTHAARPGAEVGYL